MNILDIEINEYLKRKVNAYYHGYHRKWTDTQVGFINTLKNDDSTFSENRKDFGFTLSGATNALYQILESDLNQIAKLNQFKLTVCFVPRAKKNTNYQSNQLLFGNTIKKFVINNSDKFNDGTEFITRIIDTPTTHKTRNYHSVEIGITKKTCSLSPNINGKHILLIDDIYTKSVNIDEDAIQALFDGGASNVIFYAIGKTE